ncbi:DNA ligase [Anaerocolumna aminovalerica]|uniref:ATP-dependent DNA ligase n=1 Tax=Anaerocolumna aminovalerica TaxID=1527 RepID=UPI001C0EAEF1|nr:DNA ligase [Anaerocolumna aminovalerica]MBU5331742.1 DNA ligase [Anaerocolumna aminovalerica]
MSDLFNERKVSPMLIKEEKPPFDSEDYIYELKFDGIRSVAYLDDRVDLRNRRGIMITSLFPELSDINKQVSGKCILDGELVVLKDGKPDFYEVQRRTVMRDPFKIQLASTKYPASFIVYDILYYQDKELLSSPLIERKELLQSVINENNRLIFSRYIETYGKQLYDLANAQKFEGIVAKRKDSKYYMGKKAEFWIKSKFYDSIDAVVCGYIYKPNDMTSIIIGQYMGSKLVYKGHVTLGAGIKKLNKYGYKVIDQSPFGYVPRGNEGAVWIQPDIVCTIEYMPSKREGMRLPIFREIRDDKSPIECQVD